jgi:type II secretory pathway component PulJ
MDADKLQSEEELAEAMQTLARTIREAGECLLDLQTAVELLHVANEPSLARAVQHETAACLRSAMRRR